MLILIFLFLLFLVFGMPVAYTIGISSFIYMVFIADIPLTVLGQRLINSLDSFTILAVPLFILAGNLMNVGGVTDRIFNFARTLVGHFKGGLGHVNVIASVIFSGMSGASLADAAGLGKVEIKAMVDQGFPKPFTAAVTAATSTIGPIIPPSIVMVLYGVLAEASIGKLFMAGIIPGLAMALGMMVLVAYLSHKRNYPVGEKESFRNIFKSFLDALPSLFTVVIIIGGILGGIFTPTEAAGVAVLYALILAGPVYKDLNFRQFIDVLLDTARLTGAIMFIFASASMLGWLITKEKIPEMLANFILNITDSTVVILILINIFLLILGMFMDIMSALLIVVPVFVPLVLQFGVDPVHFGVMVIFNLMIGGLTPPFAMLNFVVSKVADVPFMSVTKESMWFLIPLLIVLLIITLWPGFTLFIPSLLG